MTKWAGTMVKWVLLFCLFTFLPFTVAAQQQGCRRGVPRPQGALHRAAGTAQPRQTGGDFYHGERHQLTVLVAFSDRAFKGNEAATVTQWNKIFNVENLSESPFKGSVRDYFAAQSYGDFHVTFDLQYVVLPGKVERYASTQADDENSQYLVEDIMEVLKTRAIDWSLYDWNGDGFVNQLLIVYAGKGMNDGGGSNCIWPHQWWMSDHKKDYHKTADWDGTYCDPLPVTYGDRQYSVDCYCALAELTSRSDYGSFGTICHEYSHCFGLPDFYNDGPLANGSYVAGWDLMDSGNYNGGGYCPAGYSGHERWLMQWLSPVEVRQTTTVTAMPSLTDQGAVYFIRNDGWDNEYYFIENRQQTGWDTSLPGHGLVVFHIDYDASVWSSTEVMPNNRGYKRYTIFPANNSTTSYSLWTYPYNTNHQLTNTSLPKASLNHENVDGSKLMSKPVTDMSVTNGLASFTVTIPRTAVDPVRHTDADGSCELLYRHGPLSIVRLPNGDVRKVMMK